jgi:toxin YoeB
MTYRVELDPKASRHMERLQKNEPLNYRRLLSLLKELEVHPRTGTGKPKRLSGYYYTGCWSRRISDKHRLIYEIKNNLLLVTVSSAYGHYNDH